ncbi:MAG: hypothetical protein VB017_04795 [Endomicrobiaceae bacterium]|nr:hypothetical protein [Endomicrobiaceae bacterium]
MFLDLNSIYSSSWGIFKKNWWQYVVVSFIMFILILIPLGGILQFFVMLMMMNAILKAFRGNDINFAEFFKFKEIFNAKVIIFVVILGLYSFFLQSINNVILSAVLTLVGFIISVIFFPVLCVLIDKQFNVKETILYSARLTKELRTEILLIMLVNFVIAVLGILLFLIGIFASIPIVTIAIVKTYLLLDEKIKLSTNI